jgi:hypothetical protein
MRILRIICYSKSPFFRHRQNLVCNRQVFVRYRQVFLRNIQRLVNIVKNLLRYG